MDVYNEILSILIDKRQYNTYTLTNDTLHKYATVFTITLVLYSILSYQLYNDNKKRLAWMVSLLNSFLLSIIGIVYIIMKAPLAHDIILKTINDKRSHGRSLYHGVDNVSAIVCLWFAIANIIDLLFGFIFYRKQQGIITSYFHHSIFIWIMYACTTGNGLFLTCTPFAPSFLFMCIEEIPTFILALGSVFKSYRTDLGFGLTFFILRIMYHLCFLLYSIYAQADSLVCFLYVLSLIMHINWFYSWASKYGKNLGDKEKKK